MKVTKKNIAAIINKERKDIGKFIEDYGGLVFHEIEFNKIVSEVFNTESSYLIAINSKEQILGICPMHTTKKGPLKKTYSNPSIFEVPYGGWIFDGKQVTINQLLKVTRPSCNESLTYWSTLQIQEDIYKDNISGTQPRQTAIIDLSLAEENIWEDIIHSKRRNMIRKALKSGIKIKFFGPEGFDLYYPLMKETQKTVEKTKPQKFYKSILETYFKKKQAAVLMAESSGEFISGVILLGNKHVVHYWQGAGKRNVPNLGQGELLQWEVIKWAKQNGARYYDLCVVEKERLPNIARFKLGFSRTPVPFYYISRKPVTFKILNRLVKWF